ncbi:MAG: hypothetical protein ACRCTY_04720, partial [Candidatus Adiutrix sp.]
MKPKFSRTKAKTTTRPKFNRISPDIKNTPQPDAPKAPYKSLARQYEPGPPELLAPAGSKASWAAAVEAGADAVYVGLNDLSARTYADNFSLA